MKITYHRLQDVPKEHLDNVVTTDLGICPQTGKHLVLYTVYFGPKAELLSFHDGKELPAGGKKLPGSGKELPGEDE